jgi:hypothetical protein
MPCRSAIFSAAQPTREALARTGRGSAPRPPVWSWAVRRPAVAKRGSENVAAASPDGHRRALAQGIRQRDGGALLLAAACDQRGPDEGAGTMGRNGHDNPADSSKGPRRHNMVRAWRRSATFVTGTNSRSRSGRLLPERQSDSLSLACPSAPSHRIHPGRPLSQAGPPAPGDPALSFAGTAL